MLVKDTLRLCADYLTVAHREETEEHRAQLFIAWCSAEAPDCGDIYLGEIYGWVPLARRLVHIDGVSGDVGAGGQTPRGLDTNRIKPRLVP